MDANVIQTYRLSPSQTQIWEQHVVGRGFDPYSVCGVTVEGAADENELRRAVLAVTRRYEILRTVFQRREGMSLPLQVIGQQEAVLLETEDWSGDGGDIRRRRANDFLEGLGSYHFDYEKGPLVLVKLIKMEAEKFWLGIGSSALCLDRTGLCNLVREASRLYGGMEEDWARQPGLLQYADISEVLLESDGAAEGREYWRKKDLSSCSQIRLPLEQPDQRRFEAGCVRIAIEKKVASGIGELGRKNQASVSDVLLGFWACLICRLSGQNRVIVGVSCPCRSYEGLGEMLGSFTRQLLLIVEFEAQTGINEVVEAVKRFRTETEEWQDYFSWDHCKSEGGPGFPFGYDFVQEPGSYDSRDGIRFYVERQWEYINRFKLKLCIVEHGENLFMEFHYNRSVYERAQLERLAAYYHQLIAGSLEGMAVNPNARLSELELLGEEEKRRILEEWNATASEYPRDKTIHQLFEEQVERSPDAIAVQ